jgi:NAD(P)-dependent dehydrogenase (short-subunit alcohol dehydrogenase family)
MTGVLIVTGASTGIGAATARMGAERGYAVCVNYRKSAREADAVVADIERAGGRAVAVQADVGREEDIVRMFETVDREFGPVTALVNNAGGVPGRAMMDEITLADIRFTIDTKIVGTILCCREALRRMLPKHGGKGGAIVNISSPSSLHGAPGMWVHYGAANGGTDTYTIGLSKEVAKQKVRVNGVRPGFVITNFHLNANWPDRVDRFQAKNPEIPDGKPEEVAAGILWLLSDEASYVSGAILDIHGGFNVPINPDG